MLRSSVLWGDGGEMNPKGLCLRTQAEVSRGNRKSQGETVVWMKLCSSGRQRNIWEVPSLRDVWVCGWVGMLPILERPQGGLVHPR